MLIEYELLKDLKLVEAKCRELVEENERLKKEIEEAKKIIVQQDIEIDRLESSLEDTW